MKKIEATLDPVALDAIWRQLAEAGIDGRLTVTEVRGLENLGRFYEHETTAENPWKRLDLIVSDRQTESSVDLILRQAKLADGRAVSQLIMSSSSFASISQVSGLCQVPTPESSFLFSSILAPTLFIYPMILLGQIASTFSRIPGQNNGRCNCANPRVAVALVKIKNTTSNR